MRNLTGYWTFAIKGQLVNIPDECVYESSDPRIVVEDRGRKLTLVNAERKLIRRIKVDDCVVKGGEKRCDYLVEVSNPPTMAVYVELKGKNVDRACKQLAATLTLFAPIHRLIERRCHIVASRVPQGATLQARKKEFQRKYGVHLFIETAQAELNI